MQVYYDLDLGLFLQTPSSNNEITQLTAKRATNNPISIQFLKSGVPATLPTGSLLTFGAKQSNGQNGGFYDAEYAVYVDNTGWSGPDANGFYNATPGYNTVPLNALFGYIYPNIDNQPHPDFVTLDAEITWLLPGADLPSKTPYWTLLCYNDVSKGIEGVPTSGGPIYPPPGAIELIAHKGQPNGYAPLDATSRVPAANQTLNGWDLTDLTIAGTTTLTQAARIHTHKVLFNAGSAICVLQMGSALLGDIARIPIAMPGNINSTLQVFDVPGGSNLAVLNGGSDPYQSLIELHMGSSSWHLDFQSA